MGAMTVSTATNPFPPKMTEDQFLHVVLRLAKLNGWLVFHPLPAMNKKGRWATFQNEEGKGYPDLTLARDGVVIFRELKSNTGTLSAEQKAWGAQLGDAWGVWRPRDYEEIRRTLARTAR